MLRKKGDLRNLGVLVFDDLCQTDYDERKRLKPIMKLHYDQGRTVRFTRGMLYINGTPYAS